LGAGFIFLKIWLPAGCDLGSVFCKLQETRLRTLIKTSGCLISRALNLAQQDIQPAGDRQFTQRIQRLRTEENLPAFPPLKSMQSMKLANGVNSETGEVYKSKPFKAADIVIQNGELRLIVTNPGELEKYLV
jgi:hypothetical protein